MVIRQATPEDIDLLVSLRLDFLREEFGDPTVDGMMPELRERLEAYFCNHLGKEFFAWVAEIDGRAVSSVFCVLDEHPRPGVACQDGLRPSQCVYGIRPFAVAGSRPGCESRGAGSRREGC